MLFPEKEVLEILQLNPYKRRFIFLNSIIMAVWQYSFELLSKAWFKNIELSEILSQLEGLFWLTKDRSDRNIYLWDDKTDDCIIRIFNWKIDHISCRLDLRSINQNKVSLLKEIVEKYELKFLVIEEKVFNWKEFIENLKSSPAMKFVENPKSIFKE